MYLVLSKILALEKNFFLKLTKLQQVSLAYTITNKPDWQGALVIGTGYNMPYNIQLQTIWLYT